MWLSKSSASIKCIEWAEKQVVNVDKLRTKRQTSAKKPTLFVLVGSGFLKDEKFVL
jgi:hypothetical protein